MATKQSTKPFELDTFNVSNVEFGDVKRMQQFNMNYIPLSYRGSQKKLAFLVRDCEILKVFDKSEKSSSIGLFLRINDKNFIQMMDMLSDYVYDYGVSHSSNWFKKQLKKEDIDMKSVVDTNDEGESISNFSLANEVTIISGTSEKMSGNPADILKQQMKINVTIRF